MIWNIGYLRFVVGVPQAGVAALAAPDASWGHRSAVSTRSHGGFYGYRMDMAVCTATDLPLAWNVRTARDSESIHALPLLDATRVRGFAAENVRDG